MRLSDLLNKTEAKSDKDFIYDLLFFIAISGVFMWSYNSIIRLWLPSVVAHGYIPSKITFIEALQTLLIPSIIRRYVIGLKR